MALSGRPADVLATLQKHSALSQHPMAKPALEDMAILIGYVPRHGGMAHVHSVTLALYGLAYYI